jgi:hypothetical protein
MPPQRATAIAGLAFALTFAAGVVVLGEMFGMFGDSDATFDDYYAADHPVDIVGGALLVLSGVLFPVFVAGLVEGATARARSLATTFATLSSAGLIVGACAAATIPAARAFGGAFGDDGQATSGLWLAPSFSYLLVCAAAAWTGAAAIGTCAISSGSLVSQGAARYASVAAALVLLLAPAVMPLVALPLWAGGVSVWLVVRRAAAA